MSSLKMLRGWGCSLVVEHTLSICKALGFKKKVKLIEVVSRMVIEQRLAGWG
jgi:hypothetical protein